MDRCWRRLRMQPSSVKLPLAVIACFLATTSAAIILAYWDDIFYSFLRREMRVVEGTRAYQMFVDVPVPQYINFYFFNWTNPENIQNAKPILSQMGPYRFSIKEYKTDLTQNDNGTLSFRIKRYWFFDEKNSNGSLNDKVTTLNVIAASAGRTLKNSYAFTRAGFSVTLDSLSIDIFVRKTVKELLFDGYSDPLLDIAGTLPGLAGVDVPYDKFAWFYQRNGTDDFEGFFNMDTGENDLMNVGKLLRWNLETTTPFYEGNCGMVNGSAGELFPPKQSKTKKVEMFSADLCRSLGLSFKEEATVHGITGNKYAGDSYTFDNGTLDPSNECFCDGECSPSGVLNVTSCRLGAPGFVSFPHFYLADPYYRRQVEGMDPSPEKHTMYLNLEPNTGIPLEVAARFQINILLTPQRNIRILENVPTVYFPVIWFEHRAGVTQEIASEIRMALRVLKHGPTVAIGALAVFSFLFCLSIYTMLVPTFSEWKRRSQKKHGNAKERKAVVIPLISEAYKDPTKDRPVIASNHNHNP